MSSEGRRCLNRHRGGCQVAQVFNVWTKPGVNRRRELRFKQEKERDRPLCVVPESEKMPEGTGKGFTNHGLCSFCRP